MELPSVDSGKAVAIALLAGVVAAFLIYIYDTQLHPHIAGAISG